MKTLIQETLAIELTQLRPKRWMRFLQIRKAEAQARQGTISKDPLSDTHQPLAEPQPALHQSIAIQSHDRVTTCEC
jgi:hypothetical protein